MPEAAVTDPLRIAVLGGRSWIANAAVIPAIDACAGAVLAGLGSRSGPVTYDDVLADPAVEAVYIALPNGMHLEWVERAAAAGKHVLCEKPLAATSAEVVRMAAACDAAGVVLAEAYMTPFHPRSVEIERLLDAGELGEVRHAEAAFTFTLADDANYRWMPAQGGGALLDVGIYCLTPIVRVFGGLPADVVASAVMAPSGVDATTSIRLAWSPSATASIVTSFELPERQLLHIAGTKGSLAVERPFTPGPADTTFAITRPDGTVETHETAGGNCYVGMIDAFADAVRSRATWPRPIDDVLALTGLCETIAATASNHRGATG
ncbi:MAG: Gfo/Idh/MocA family oxidoreductase [Ilumatobacteraceae bacterium]